MKDTYPLKGPQKNRTRGLRQRAAHDPRSAALAVVYQVIHEDLDSQPALDKALASGRLVPSDKRLCTELVYGVLRQYLFLREQTDGKLKNPDKIPAEMRLAIGMALYEMLWLRIPPRATVHWAVEHVRNRFGAALAGVANGVLRNLQRDLKVLKQQVSGPVEQADVVGLSRKFSMPGWIVSLWLDQYGFEDTLQLLCASAQGPPSGLRVNAAHPDAEKLTSILEGLNPDPTVRKVGKWCFSFEGSLPWQGREAVSLGRASRQSPASWEALFHFGPDSWKQPIWDACAGRGGKTLALLETGIAVALASDPSSGRISGLPKEFERLHLTGVRELPHIAVGEADHLEGIRVIAEREGDPPASFGTILVDAPCSGLGTLARRPEIRLRREQGDLERLVRVQKSILDAAWKKLLPGGSLVYLTCTRNRQENQEQTASFLSRRPDARLMEEYETPADSPLREFFYGSMIQKDSDNS